jgi:hypothetical protein
MPVWAPGEPPVRTTEPYAGSLADEIVMGSPSGSVSFASTSMGAAPESSATVAPSSTAVGPLGGDGGIGDVDTEGDGVAL